MPMYAYECGECNHVDDCIIALHDRDVPKSCPECGGVDTMKRLLSVPYIAAIPGIPNRINRHWNEGDRNTKMIPMDGRRDERKEFIRRASKKK